MTDQHQISIAVETLARARRELAAADTALHAVEAAFYQQPTVVALNDRASMAKDIAVAAEHQLREMAVAYYLETEDKKALPGAVTVVVSEKLDYDIRTATEWAAVNLPVAITAPTLNTRTFEKVLGAMDGLPNFVTVRAVPSVRIAQDLDAALGLSVQEVAA